MENALGEDLPVGVYRSNENVKHFKIKVKLRKILNVCLQEKDSLNFQDSIELVNLMKSPSKEIERVFRWQEKKKKQSGESENENRKSDLDNISLISLSDTDIFNSQWKSVRSSTHPLSPPSHLENMILDIKSRRLILQSLKQGTWQKPFFLDTKQLVKSQACYKRSSPFPFGQSMVIMARLDYEDSPREEIELCYLHINIHGVLTVVPDFCKDKLYTFVNSRSETFQYSLESMLGCIQSEKTKRNQKTFKKIEIHRRKLLENSIGKEFFVPSSNTLLCCLNSEIVSATNFSARDIFIHYKFEFPDDWVLNNEVLEGVTQTCRSKKKLQKTVAYFGYIFSQEIEIDLEKFLVTQMPKLQLIIEVTSVDKWGNFRNEGYGYCEIMLKSGICVSKINTWMLRPTNLTNRLRHFFIGGTPCLENFSYIRIPSDAQQSELSKYGLRTETSGIVEIKSFLLLHSSTNES